MIPLPWKFDAINKFIGDVQLKKLICQPKHFFQPNHGESEFF